MNIKKLIIITLALLTVISLGSVAVSADGNVGITVYLTVTGQGQRTVTREAMTVTDAEGGTTVKTLMLSDAD